MNLLLQLKIKNRQELLDLKRNSKINNYKNLLYIYSLEEETLEEETIRYPFQKGKTLYIGKSESNAQLSGERFSHHIAKSQDNGADQAFNFGLTQYYYSTYKIQLEIYDCSSWLTNGKTIEDLEREFIYAHIKEFGIIPVCQGKIPSPKNCKNKTNKNIWNEIKNSQSITNFIPYLR